MTRKNRAGTSAAWHGVLVIAAVLALMTAGCVSVPGPGDDPTSPPGPPSGDNGPVPQAPVAPPENGPPEEGPDEGPTTAGPSYDPSHIPEGAEVLPDGRLRVDLQHNGNDRWFLYYVPPDLPTDKPAPVMVLIHAGSGGPNHVLRVTETRALADEHGFIILTPTGHVIPNTDPTQYSWRALDCCPIGEEDPDDVDFILTTLDWLQDRYWLDTERFGVAGHSEGATLTHMVVAAAPERFRYGAAVAGTTAVQRAPGLPWISVQEPAQPANIIISHSTDDPQMPYYGGIGPLSLKPWLVKASVATGVAHWTAAFGGEPIVEVHQRDGYEEHIYRDPASDHRVVHLRTTGGHNWPGIEDADMFPYTVLVQTPDTPYFPGLMVEWLLGDLP